MRKMKNPRNASLSTSQAVFINVICTVFLAVGFRVANDVYSVNLVSNPTLTLRVISVIEFSVVVLVYSYFRQDPEKSSYWKALGRGVLGLPIGALANALGAIALGAPVGLKYEILLPKKEITSIITRYLLMTIDWSILMSLLTFVPASSVYGSSWTDWQRIFSITKLDRSIDFIICIPAHGAIIGAWFGAWPMPLDWERPWQEWPICVTYGAMAGYVIGMVISVGFVFTRHKKEMSKTE